MWQIDFPFFQNKHEDPREVKKKGREYVNVDKFTRDQDSSVSKPQNS